MIEAMITSLIILITGLAILLSGRFVKRNMLFSIYVPDTHQTDAEVTALITRFRTRVITAAVISAVINMITMLLNDNIAIVMFIVLINLLLVADLFFYRQANEQLKALKEQHNWMQGIKVIRTADTAAREDSGLVPWQMYLIPLALLTVSTIFVMINYADIPERIAVHWNLNNEPDRWEDKSIVTVFYPVFVGYGIILLMMAINSGINYFPMMLNPAAKDASKNYENSIRKNNSYLIYILTVVMALMFGFIIMQPLILPPGYMPDYMFPLLIGGLFVPTIISLIYQFRADRKYRETAALTDKAPYHNDDHYKWGIFYYNKKDPNVWVPKVSQFGMTMNFARPEAVIISMIILLVTCLPIIILIILNV